MKRLPDPGIVPLVILKKRRWIVHLTGGVIEQYDLINDSLNFENNYLDKKAGEKFSKKTNP